MVSIIDPADDYLVSRSERQRALHYSAANHKVNRNLEVGMGQTMISQDEIISRVKQIVDSDVSRDEALREAVRILKTDCAHYNWVGIYLLDGQTLVLHNYIGKPTEHTHIPVGQGVCGTAVAERTNQIIDDVTAIDNYLACSLETRAEIVVLIRRDDDIFGQIDIDSDTASAFTSQDEALLEAVADLLARRF
jgi:GAF domain-containing protein